MTRWWRQAAGPAGIVRPEFRAGDLLIFDELMLHRTAAEPSMHGDRRAIETVVVLGRRLPGRARPPRLVTSSGQDTRRRNPPGLNVSEYFSISGSATNSPCAAEDLLHGLERPGSERGPHGMPVHDVSVTTT